jgi:alkylhydroperoxidase family enzyme
MADKATIDVERVGSPLAPRTAADTDGDVQRILTKLDAAGINKHIMRLLANCSTAFRPFTLLTTSLLSSVHYPRLDQEVVILHLAARRSTQYEWEEHVPMALESGVHQAQIDAIERDRGAIDTDQFTADQLLAVELADQLIDNARIRTETWSRAVDTWGTDGTMDLFMSVAVWGAFVPTVIEGLGLVHVPEGSS